jgi:hypothetical protein
MMATRVDLPPLPPFDPTCDQTSVSQRWKTWTKRFETYLIATNITDDRQKRAMLLYQAGPDTQDIFDTLELETRVKTTTQPKESSTNTLLQKKMLTSKYFNFAKLLK